VKNSEKNSREQPTALPLVRGADAVAQGATGLGVHQPDMPAIYRFKIQETTEQGLRHFLFFLFFR